MGRSLAPEESPSEATSVRVCVGSEVAAEGEQWAVAATGVEQAWEAISSPAQRMCLPDSECNATQEFGEVSSVLRRWNSQQASAVVELVHVQVPLLVQMLSLAVGQRWERAAVEKSRQEQRLGQQAEQQEEERLEPRRAE